MASSTWTSAAPDLGAQPEDRRESAKDVARRHLEALLAEKPELLDALSDILSAGEHDARAREAAGGAEREGGREPPEAPRRLERAGPRRAPVAGEAPPHVCSWCRRVRVTPERWVPAADYARERGAEGKPVAAAVLFQLATNGICPDCYLSVVGHGHRCACGGQAGGQG